MVRSPDAHRKLLDSKPAAQGKALQSCSAPADPCTKHTDLCTSLHGLQPPNACRSSMLNTVVDSSALRVLYCAGQDEGSYSFFVGKDASRAYITGGSIQRGQAVKDAQHPYGASKDSCWWPKGLCLACVHRPCSHKPPQPHAPPPAQAASRGTSAMMHASLHPMARSPHPSSIIACRASHTRRLQG